MAKQEHQGFTQERIAFLLKQFLRVLEKSEDGLRFGELAPIVESNISLSSYEKSPNPSSGGERWKTHVQYYSIDLVKANWIKKAGRKWYITNLGQEALALDDLTFIKTLRKHYQDWKKQRNTTGPDDDDEDSEIELYLPYEQARESSRTSIDKFLRELDAFKFQNLVGWLFRGMGYIIKFEAKPNVADGGIDLVAFVDPLGVRPPHIKIQVKHWLNIDKATKVQPKEIQQLRGALRKNMDVGVFVSSGGFTGPAKREAEGDPHIELIDIDRFMELWIEYYDKVPKEGQKELPLAPVHFLAPIEEEQQS